MKNKILQITKLIFFIINLFSISSLIYADEFEIESLKIGTKSITTKCFVEKQGEPLVEAEYVNVFIDLKTRKPIEIPNELRELLL